MSVGRWLDKSLSVIAPSWALKRFESRQLLEMKLSLEAGRIDRTTKSRRAKPEAGDPTNLAEVQRARFNAWQLYRDNPRAKKIVRTILAQVIGHGMWPEPMAQSLTGNADESLRSKLKLEFKKFARFPMLERPGFGGLTWTGFQRLALREVVVSGEVLIRMRSVPSDLRKDSHRTGQMMLEVIESDRLAENESTLVQAQQDHYVFRGIEFDKHNRRKNYLIYDQNPHSPRSGKRPEIKPVPAHEIIHLYMQDRASQERGITLLAAVLLALRNIGDYEENELVASAVAACFSVLIKTQSPVGAQTLATPAGSTDTTDMDGNIISRLQPGLMARLGVGEDVVPVNPMRSSSQVEGFSNHLLRSLAAGLPGVKSSQVIGDYREASFASERSASNDSWAETADMQDWFATNLCQPIYERWIEMNPSMVDGRIGKDMMMLALAEWRGPTPKSINPTEDAQAATARQSNGTSSVIDENLSIGRDARETAKKNVEFIEYAKKIGVPELLIAKYFGLPALEKEEPVTPPGQGPQSKGGTKDSPNRSGNPPARNGTAPSKNGTKQNGVNRASSN